MLNNSDIFGAAIPLIDVKTKEVIDPIFITNVKTPTSEEELQTIEFNGIAVFYTVWSHEKGMGRQVLNNTLNIISNRATNTRFITLSPKTDMATKFHLSNGAILLQQNLETNNFEYKI